MNTTMNDMPVAVSSNPVTAAMIAEKLGLTVDTVLHCMSKNFYGCSYNTVDLVRKTAKEMGYSRGMASAESMANWKSQCKIKDAEAKAETVQNAINKNKGRRCISQKQIAKDLGISTATVNQALRGNGPWADHVIRYAKQTEYSNPRSAEAKAKRKEEKAMDYLMTHNFPSKEAETKRMTYLRAQGYSNKEIAQKVGRCVLTVRRRIGTQEEDMSVENRIYGQKNRAARNAQRRQYVADHTVRTYNGLVTELCDVKTRVAKLETEVQQLKPAAIQAAKISRLQMIEDISDAPSTALQ